MQLERYDHIPFVHLDHDRDHDHDHDHDHPVHLEPEWYLVVILAHSGSSPVVQYLDHDLFLYYADLSLG